MKGREKIMLSPPVTAQYRRLLKMANDSVHEVDTAEVRKAFLLIGRKCNAINNCIVEDLMIESIQIAQIVVKEIGLGTSSVTCSMLYKLVEKEIVSPQEVEQAFGEKLGNMMTDMLRIAQVDTSNTRTQAENFRKLLLTLVSDVRVILIKIAERLHLMRNLAVFAVDIQKQNANEVFDLYAPLAHRLGLYNIKTELEDLALRFRNPEMYHFIEKKMEETASERSRFIKNFIAPIKEQLDTQGFKYEIKSRTKSINSIWNKMRKQQVEFDEVFDLFAIRIITNSEPKDEKTDCWRVFSVVTSLYQPNPERMRDWISVPKSTGYESLHSTVVVPGGQWVEVQIRSRRMDEIAEKGLAAHWKYKGQKAENSGLDEWLNRIRELLETTDTNTQSLMDDLKEGLDANEIFVFTPKGELRKFPKGATALDFAFEIHSNVGMTCVGARINGKSVPIRYVMNNGDKVEVITSKNQKPKHDWLDFVATSKAKNKIRQALKEEKQKEADDGKEILQRRLKNWKIEFNDLIINKLIKHFKLKNAVDLYTLVATEELNIADLKNVISDFEKPETSSPTERLGDVAVEKIIPAFSEKSDDVMIIEEKLVNVDYKLAKCCNPIFGDEVFGFVTISEGIKIHRHNCPNAKEMLSKYGYRLVHARWAGTDSKIDYQTAIKVSGLDEIGILSKITDVVSKDLKVNVRSINFDTKDGVFEGVVKVFVKDTSHLDVLIHKFLKVKGIISAHRIDLV